MRKLNPNDLQDRWFLEQQDKCDNQAKAARDVARAALPEGTKLVMVVIQQMDPANPSSPLAMSLQSNLSQADTTAILGMAHQAGLHTMETGETMMDITEDPPNVFIPPQSATPQ